MPTSLVQEGYEWLRTFLSDNQFASGGLLLAGFSAIAYQIRNVPLSAYRWAKKRLVLSYEFTNDDLTYDWLLEWLCDHPRMKDLSHVSVKVQLAKNKWVDQEDLSSGKKKERRLEFKKVPAIGAHWIWDEWLTPMRIHRSRNEEAQTGQLAPREHLEIVAPIWARRHLDALLKSVADKAMPHEAGIDLQVNNRSNYWRLAGRADGRPLQSVICPDGLKEAFLEDIQIFRAARVEYARVGTPWRRGYLLEGPPGNGKTSLIRALATELDFSLAIVNLNTSGLDDPGLLELLNGVDQETIVLLEDIDAAFTAERKKEDKESSRLTFSGLLNAIDGAATAGQGRTMILTTNYPEKLDPALLRPGRVDRRFHLGNPTPREAKALFEWWFPDASPGEAEAFSMKATGKLSMAELQGLLLELRSHPASRDHQLAE